MPRSAALFGGPVALKVAAQVAVDHAIWYGSRAAPTRNRSRSTVPPGRAAPIALRDTGDQFSEALRPREPCFDGASRRHGARLDGTARDRTRPMADRSLDYEPKIREAHTAGQLEAAASTALEAYGDEILSFLFARLRNPGDAQEAFSMFAEDLWVGLPNFVWRCSMRTWAYTLARNAATRYATAPQRRAARNVVLSDAGRLSELVERMRSATQTHQQTAVKDRFRALREQLEPEDQMLLVLRVDRGLAWRDLAMTMAGDVELGEETLEREATRLRKAFERVKRELKRLAERDGLLKQQRD